MSMSLIHYQLCPVCSDASIYPELDALDHTVSKNSFSIWECAKCGLRFTQDAPGKEAIRSYYQADTYISHSDTREGLVNRLYHSVRNFTLQQKKKLLVKETGIRKGSLLDIGAGTGAFLDVMKRAGWSVKGLEPDPGARKTALGKYGITLADTSELFTMPPQSFDAITLWHVLEHVHDLHGYLIQIKKMLSPGGLLVLALPNYTSVDAHYYGSYWAAYDVPRHLYHFSPDSVKELLERHGFSLKKTKPMWFDPFYISLLSEKYRSGNQNYLNACRIGVVSTFSSVSDSAKASSIIYIART